MDLFVLNRVLSLLVALEGMEMNVDSFDGFVVDQLFLVDPADMQMGYPKGYQVQMIYVHWLTKALAVHENAAYILAVRCVTMAFGKLQLK